MIIHKEGYKLIVYSGLLLLLLNFIVLLIVPLVIFIIFFALSLMLFLVIIWFFRNPTRQPVLNDNFVYAPADGKVVVIEEVIENEYFHDNRRQISIFMSPLNVHVNRYPAGGLVKYFKYHPGKYLVAWNPKSSIENERATVVIETGSKKEILIRQIAGVVARRIVTYSKINTIVSQGEELGFIKFGSRVDILLPLNSVVKITLDQKVAGNKTIIAEI